MIDISSENDKIINMRVRKFYSKYLLLLRNNGIEEEDIKQELYCILFKLFNVFKNKTEEEYIKLWHNAITWYLKDLVGEIYYKTSNEFIAEIQDVEYKNLKPQEKYSKEDIIKVIEDNFDTRYQIILLMKLIENFSITDISKVLNLSRKTVSIDYNNALRKLRKLLQEEI